MDDPVIRVTNLAQFTKALKQVDSGLVREMKAELKAIADPIAAEIRGKVPRGKTGRAAGSVKVSATQRGAAIKAGGANAPYFQFLDFGGSVGRGHKPGGGGGAIKRDWLGKPQGDGRYVYPTISSHREDTKAALGKAIATAGRDAGFEVR